MAAKTEKNTEAAPDAIPVAKTEKQFSKEQILASKAYQDKRDLINALLEDDKTYTRTEVKKIVEAYLKKEVN